MFAAWPAVTPLVVEDVDEAVDAAEETDVFSVFTLVFSASKA